MAINTTITTQFGEERECYIRLNNVEANNHGAPARALFRGFLSKDAYATGAAFVWEKEVEFEADVASPIWPQAYVAMIEQEGMPSDEV